MIDGSKNRDRQLAFELQNSHLCEKRSNVIVKSVWFIQISSLLLRGTQRQFSEEYLFGRRFEI